MLIYTGFRLASPKEFAHTLHKGAEQLAIFIITIIVTLATDLLLGIAAGIITKIVIHLINGLPLKSVFKPVIEILHMEDTDVYRVDVFNAAVFSNFIGLKKRLDAIPKGKDVTVDLSAARLVDHTVMEHLHHYENDYISSGGKFSIIGLDNHKPISGHPLAARKLAKG
jgi:MFS superfamily sulfate permease-like transporter